MNNSGSPNHGATQPCTQWQNVRPAAEGFELLNDPQVVRGLAEMNTLY